MHEELFFSTNGANQGELLAHLNRCDELFVPRLNERTNIEAYCKKIRTNCVRFEAWHEQALIGCVATYCNDKKKRVGYITNVSVVPEWQSRGIATRLMSDCFNHVIATGFNVLELEVDYRNLLAVTFYRKLGFELIRRLDTSQTMAINLSASSDFLSIN